MKADLENMRKKCRSCQENHPSLPKEPPKGVRSPKYPMEQCHADYFHLAGKVFLLIVDAYTSWPIVRECGRGGTALELRDQLIEAFTNWGIPEILVTDGGPQFTAHTTQEFLRKWGVHHRITSAYNPHANLRAETGVKSMKRILTDNVGHGMKLNGKKAAVALMEYKQTPIRETGRTPAKMMLGRELRDLIQVKDTLDPGRYLIQETYQLKSEDRERAYAAKYLKENDRWAEHTKQQTPLNVGDPVFCQSMRGKDIGKWTTTGTIHRADQTNSTYQIRMDGTNRLAKRFRINLRK